MKTSRCGVVLCCVVFCRLISVVCSCSFCLEYFDTRDTPGGETTTATTTTTSINSYFATQDGVGVLIDGGPQLFSVLCSLFFFFFFFLQSTLSLSLSFFSFLDVLGEQIF